MLNDWVDTTLGEVTEVIAMGPFGSSIKVETFVPGGVPVISGRHLKATRLIEDKFNYISVKHADQLRKANVGRGDVVLTHAGTIGQVAYIPRDSQFARYCLSQRQFFMRPRTNIISPEFLTLFLESPTGQRKLLAARGGTGVPSILKPVTHSRSIPLRLPPLSVQRRIVDLGGALDAQIEALKAEQMSAEAHLVSACRTLTNVAHCRAILPLLNVADLLDRLRQPINDSERQSRIGSVPYLGANGQVGWIDRALFDEPLVLLAEDGGPVSEWATKPQAYTVDGPAWVNNHAHVLRATQVPRDWLYYSLRHYDLTTLATTGTRTKLTQANMRQIQIGLPEDVETSTLTLRAIEAVAGGIREERYRLLAVREVLLGALLTGAVQIPNSYDAVLEAV